MRISIFADHIAGVRGLDVGIVARGGPLAASRNRGLRLMIPERIALDPRRQRQLLGPERAIACV